MLQTITHLCNKNDFDWSDWLRKILWRFFKKQTANVAIIQLNQRLCKSHRVFPATLAFFVNVMVFSPNTLRPLFQIN